MGSFIRRNAEIILRILVVLIPIAIGAVCLYLDHRGADPAYLFVYGVIVPIAVYLTVISELALSWLFKQLRKDAVVYVETFSNALLFANARAAIVAAIDPNNVRYDMLSTSHCNLFARPEGENPEQTDLVARVNKHLFESMAKISLDPNSEGRIRVLLYADNEKDLNFELDQRKDILTAVSRNLGRQWDQGHFRYGFLAARSLKDYLVIEDHVFTTIRRVEFSNDGQEYRGNQARYIHIKNKGIADSYRSWLRDLFDNGSKGGYVRDHE
jgi:hypothetical protein